MKNAKKDKIRSFIYVSAVILLSLIPRLWSLKDYPPIIVDEAANIRVMDEVIKTGRFNPLDFHWDFSQSRLVYSLPLFISFLSSNNDLLLSLRLSSLIFSLLSLIPFFYLIKSLTNKDFAFLATLLFSYSYYFLQFSRVGWIDTIMGVTVGLYLIWLVQISSQKKSIIWPIICGFLSAIIFTSYRGGVIFIITAPFYLLYLLRKRGGSHRLFLKFAIAFFITFILAGLPWAIKIHNSPEKYNLRMNVVSVNNVETPYHDLINKTDIYKYQVITSIRSWIFLEAIDGGREENPRYLPLKNPPVNLFVRTGFYIGLIVAILNIKKFWPWLCVFSLGIVLGQILTVNPPNGARGLIILPVIYLFFAIGLYKLYLKTGKSRLLLYMFILLSFIYSFLDFSYYQYWMTWIKV